MRAAEMRQKSERELTEYRRELEAELFKARMDVATRQVHTHARIRTLRRSLARLNTIQLEQQKGATDA